MARPLKLIEALPSREFVISNTASASALLHPAIRPVGAATNFVTNVGGGAFQARVRLNLVSGGTAAQNMVLIGVAGATQNVTVFAINGVGGTRVGADLVAGPAYLCPMLASAAGLVDVTFTFANTTATVISILYGPYQIQSSVTVN